MTAFETIFFVTQRPLLPERARKVLALAGFSVEPSLVTPGQLASSPGRGRRLVLIDASGEIPWRDMVRAAQDAPESVFVACCDAISPAVVHIALTSGMHGVISMKAPLDEAAPALVQICQGERRMCFDSAEEPHRADRLTQVERKVLLLAASGWRNRDIARALGKSEGAVKVHVHHLLRKTGARTRQELAKAVSLLSDGEEQPKVRAAAASGAAPCQFDSLWMFGEAECKESNNSGGNLTWSL